MKTLLREEWVSVCREYRLHITPGFLREYNEFLHATYEFVDNAQFELTEQDIIDAWNSAQYNDSYQGILNSIFVKGWKDGHHYFRQPIELGDFLYDLLSDEIWDQPYDEGRNCTEEFNDSVLEYTDED